MDAVPDFEASSGMSHADIIAARDNVLAARTVTVAVRNDTATQDITAANIDVPDMGVSPFIRRDDGLYIYTSHLSGHVQALLAKQCASFMIAVDESACKNIWARNRLKFSGGVVEVARDDPVFAGLCDDFATAHGNTMTLIRDFTDFHMLRIIPKTGVLVLGFAKAFCVEGAGFDIVAHLSRA